MAAAHDTRRVECAAAPSVTFGHPAESAASGDGSGALQYSEGCRLHQLDSTLPGGWLRWGGEN